MSSTTEPNALKFLRLPKSDVWHFHPNCQHYRRMERHYADVITEFKRPSRGELCNECQSKSKRDRTRNRVVIGVDEPKNR